MADVTAAVLANRRFRAARDAITVRSVIHDLAAIVPELLVADADWNHSLLCASALTGAESESAVDAALRVAQACFTDAETAPAQRNAAALLLERMGNRRAVELAERRALVDEEAWVRTPPALRLDVVRRRIELTIPSVSGPPIHANEFQRRFWAAAAAHGWLSVSAPTSTGKSYIVMRWFEEVVAGRESFRGVYVVPTRALIDEVSRDLRHHFAPDVGIYVIPWDSQIGERRHEIFVFTQERFHLMQELDPAFAADLLFLDEAQKVGDDARGVLLQRVLDEAVRRNPGGQVLFASPSTANPELLLEGAPSGSRTEAVVSEIATVNQNLLWVNPAAGDPVRWDVELVSGEKPLRVGHVVLDTAPGKIAERLPLVAVAVGGAGPGNVVYVNGAAAAESAANVIAHELRDRVDLSEHPEIIALRELITKTINPSYRLVGVLERGVGFHYGNMPLIVRAEVERLFRAEVLGYLVCTSTLLEGVNLPCRNVFARAPQRGSGRPMTTADFWNLAGRAGRWGTEFRGNAVCVDTPAWEEAPRAKVRQRLERASDVVLSDLERLRRFIGSDAPEKAAADNPLAASVFSFLAARAAAGIPLATIPGLALDAAEIEDLTKRIRVALEPVELPAATIARHAGVSPTAMQVLLDYFRGHRDPDRLRLMPPGSDEAFIRYTQALSRCRDYLGADFGSDKRCAMLGVLVRDWMRGYPLARLVAERIRYQQAGGNERQIARLIRETLDDVEQVARFSAPKYLACYSDVHTIYLAERKEVPAIGTDDLTRMLELGVSEPVQVALMGLGLSRTAVIALSAHIEEGMARPSDALTWLRGLELDQLAIPELVRIEAQRLLDGE